MVRSFGSEQHRYRRECQKLLRWVTAAIQLLPGLRLVQGFALDLTTKFTDGSLWDFDLKAMCGRAMKKVRQEKPLLPIGSPLRTAFSKWQRINDKLRCPVTMAAEKMRVIEHLRLCVSNSTGNNCDMADASCTNTLRTPPPAKMKR